MSFASRSARVLARAGIAAAVVIGAGCASAQAATLPEASLPYTCKFPIVDKQPMTLVIKPKFPSPFMRDVDEVAFDATLIAKGDTNRLINTLNAYSLVGKLDLSVDVTHPDGFVQNDLLAPFAFERWVRPSSAPVQGDVVLNAAGEPFGVRFESDGSAKIDLRRIAVDLDAFREDGVRIPVRKLTTDDKGNPVTELDYDKPSFSVYCSPTEAALPPIAQFNVVHGDPCEVFSSCPLPAVTGLKSTFAGPLSVSLQWNALNDPDPRTKIREYRIYQGATLVKSVPGTSTTALITGLSSNTKYSFAIDAVTENGIASPRSNPITVFTPVVDTAPIAPKGLTVTAQTSTSISLGWTASPPHRDLPIAGYNIYRDGVKVGTTTVPGYNVTGLNPSTKYSFTVDAFDGPGLLSQKSAAIEATTLPAGIPSGCAEGFACQAYGIAGKTELRTLTRGTLPIKGGIDASLNVSTGAFTADLVLNPTSGRLVAAGFLPVTVSIAFAPSGKTTGTLDDQNVLRSNSKVRIKVSNVKLFGAIPLAGGNSCQTKSLSDINLQSTASFEIFKGGTLTGSFAISDLNGCGPLNGLVSPLTAGKGNTLSLDLTPKS